MPNTAVINMTVLNAYAFEPLGGSLSCWDRIWRFVENLESIDKILIIDTENREVPLEADFLIVDKPLLEKDMFSRLYEKFGSEDGHLLYFFGDTPFLDPLYAKKLYERHLHYGAEYTFGDGFSYGLTIEIIKKSILSDLVKLSATSKDSVQRDSLFKTIQKDINNYDLETEISPKDLRLLRLNLSTESRSNIVLLNTLSRDKADTVAALTDYVESCPENLRTLPYYYSIQISGTCPQKCGYCPFPGFDSEYQSESLFMAKKNLKLILDKIDVFTPEAYVSLSLWGEPSLHPEIYDILEMLSQYDNLKFVIETSGIGWDLPKLKAELTRQNEKILIIHSLDSIDPALYKTLRGDNYQEAMAFADFILENFPENGHIQVVRMNGNEEHLEDFYRTIKEKTENIIIQKYNHFSELLENRKVTDLSPLDRNPCWALNRELAVLLNGDVIQCRNQIRNFTTLGNLINDSLESVWKEGSQLYKKHIKGEYPGICDNCDEYYVFNF